MTRPMTEGGAENGARSRPTAEDREAGEAGRRSHWPLAIVIGLVLVAIVNVVFIVIAVRGGEPVVESYSTGQR